MSADLTWGAGMDLSQDTFGNELGNKLYHLFLNFLPPKTLFVTISRHVPTVFHANLALSKLRLVLSNAQ
jgi:hypothetical protein